MRGQAIGPSVLGLGPQLAHRQGNYASLSSHAKWLAGTIARSLDVDNFLNTKGNIFALGTPFTVASEHQASPQRPRTVRLGMNVRY